MEQEFPKAEGNNVFLFLVQTLYRELSDLTTGGLFRKVLRKAKLSSMMMKKRLIIFCGACFPLGHPSVCV